MCVACLVSLGTSGVFVVAAAAGRCSGFGYR